MFGWSSYHLTTMSTITVTATAIKVRSHRSSATASSSFSPIGAHLFPIFISVCSMAASEAYDDDGSLSGFYHGLPLIYGVAILLTVFGIQHAWGMTHVRSPARAISQPNPNASKAPLNPMEAYPMMRRKAEYKVAIFQSCMRIGRIPPRVDASVIHEPPSTSRASFRTCVEVHAPPTHDVEWAAQPHLLRALLTLFFNRCFHHFTFMWRSGRHRSHHANVVTNPTRSC